MITYAFLTYSHSTDPRTLRIFTNVLALGSDGCPLQTLKRREGGIPLVDDDKDKTERRKRSPRSRLRDSTHTTREKKQT